MPENRLGQGGVKPLRQLHVAAGFSLIELAIVLLIVGLVLGGVLVTISNTTNNARRSTTEAQLEQVTDALYGFAQVNGRLPCPSNNTDGIEDIAGGVCSAYHGFVPATTLGLFGSVNDDGLLVDAWQNPLRYSVAALIVGGNRAFTDSVGMVNLFNNADTELDGDSADLLEICSTTACGGAGNVIIAESVAALVLSMGANWPTYTSAEELDNSGGVTLSGYPVAADNIFVATGFSEENFDDLLTWVSPHILMSRLVQAGQLP